MSLPIVPSLQLISERLQLIFPEGTEHRAYVIREMAAKTIYVMFYCGALQGTDYWIRPSQVTDMTDEQAASLDDEVRQQWIKTSLSSKKKRPQNCWYATNSREPIRDETIRSGFIPCGAVIERQGLPVTTPLPKYCMNLEFANLFNPDLTDEDFLSLANTWQERFLNKAALARLRIIKASAVDSTDAITVIDPTGTKRSLSPGKSSFIAKAVIEVFAPQFLKKPSLLWLSESGKKVVAQDDELAKALGLTIDPKKALPDLILVDLGDNVDGSDMLVLFIEIVATDGPITRERKAALTTLALDAGFHVESLAFLTAFADRSSQPFRKAIGDLAWGSFAWFCSEPDHIIELRDGKPEKLRRF
jgi:hypothetical protein